MLALHQTSDRNSQHRKFLTFFVPARKSSITDAKCHGFVRRKPNADIKKQKLMEWRWSGLSWRHRQPRSITSTNSAQYNMLSTGIVQKSTSGYAIVVHGRPKTPKNTSFWGSPIPQESYSPYILGDITRHGHVTCVLVWSKSDRRRLRKTLHKQTDTTKIMVTWPWTN